MNDRSELSHEIGRRRTFAIISHPDAGKTALTEKLLLYGGVIQLAGAVKAKRGRAGAVSDWMEMERERGISITTSVLQFPYRGQQMNLLDTPGHADFSEDTYRTLHAVDGAVMQCRAPVTTHTAQVLAERAAQMRAAPTNSEARLWQRLRANQLGTPFRRQVVGSGFIADFLAREARLIVEVDGAAYHARRARAYERRDRKLRRLGIACGGGSAMRLRPAVVARAGFRSW